MDGTSFAATCPILRIPPKITAEIIPAILIPTNNLPKNGFSLNHPRGVKTCSCISWVNWFA